MPVSAATAARSLRASAAMRARRAHDGEVHEGSDVDLAVGGMSGEAYVAALGWMSANLPCAVDLVRLEDAVPAFGNRIRREGARL